MRIKPIFLSLVLLSLCLCVIAPEAHGQRWYDEHRDQKAREAAKIAEEIASKSNFEAQMRNVDKFAERDLDVYFKGAERQMELDINTIRTWNSVKAIVARAETTLKTSTFVNPEASKQILDDMKKECSLRTTSLGISICNAKAQLKVLKDAQAAAEKAGNALDEELKTRLEKIDGIETLVNKTQSFLISDADKSKTVSELSKTFAGLAETFLRFNTTLQRINNDTKDDLKLLLQRIAVETLQLEVDHWKNIGEINLRRSAEEADLNYVLRDVKLRLSQIPKCFGRTPEQLGPQEIRATITEALVLKSCDIDNPEEEGKQMPISGDQMVVYVFQTLHGTAALAARGDTPFKLAELRQAHELHRFSIRKSQVVARGYELALRTGTNRLSRFYAGGVKPEKIAQLIHSAATLAIPGVIAGN